MARLRLKGHQLSCCERGTRYVDLRFKSDLLIDGAKTRAAFIRMVNKTQPDWVLIVEPVGQFGRAGYEPVTCCPFCCTPVPKLRKRKRPPAKFLVVVDNGYYCDTCRDRLNGCACPHPEVLWEKIK